MSVELLSLRGTSVCRGCASNALETVLDLGEQPLANELPWELTGTDEEFPLHLRICTTCGLGQVGEFVLPERIFGNYPYLSSVSKSWVAHARRYVETMTAELDLSSQDLVVEVASNDGYLLKEFLEVGTRVLGVEPARNVAEVARRSGVRTISDFFGLAVARSIVREHGRPRLVAANNVYAHVPDMADFTAGLAWLCDDLTMITIENPSFLNLLMETHFDTIYHEHFSYLTAHAVAVAIKQHGLSLVRVEQLSTHGGSNRYWIRRTGTAEPDESVAEALHHERELGLFDPTLWERFASSSMATITGLRAWLDERTSSGARVAGYGAAAKGNTLLNAAAATSKDLLAVADGSHEKQGRFLPGSRVPIVTPDDLAALDPTDVVILPWNLSSEIVPILGERVPAAHAWIAVPHMQQVGAQ